MWLEIKTLTPFRVFIYVGRQKSSSEGATLAGFYQDEDFETLLKLNQSFLIWSNVLNIITGTIPNAY